MTTDPVQLARRARVDQICRDYYTDDRELPNMIVDLEEATDKLRADLAALRIEHDAHAVLLDCARRDRDEARDTAVELRRRLATRPLAVCAYCATPMPEPDGFDGTTAARVAWMDAHMRTCEEHPAGIAIRERDELRAALGSRRVADSSDNQCYAIIGACTRMQIGVTHGEAGKRDVLSEEPAATTFVAISRSECPICSEADAALAGGKS